MLKSMTGYGRHEETLNGRRISAEIKSVNHKFFEVSQRITRGYNFLEDAVKSYIQSKVSRGKIDVFIQIETLESTDVQVLVNHSLANGYISAFRELGEKYSIKDEISFSLLSKYSDIFSVHKKPEDEEEITKAVILVLEKAVKSFVDMRKAEGARLKDDILKRAANIIEIVKEIEEITPKTIAAYRERLYTKLSEILEDRQIDEQRLITEAAIFADKVAVDEETVRLKSHFEQLKIMLKSEEPVGRKIDFLIQEMNREANTITSKSVNSEIAYKIVDVKAEIEKIREQVQNIE